MAPRKRPAGKKPAQKPAVTKTVEFSPDRRITVSVGTSLDFGKAKVGLAQSENIKNDADVSEQIDSIYDSLVEKLEEKFDDICERVGGEEEPADEEYEDDAGSEEEAGDDDGEWEDDDSDSGDAEEGEEDGEEEGDLTEEDILAMKKAELVELVDEEGLDDINKKLPIKKLREAVIDAFFEPEGEEGEEEGEDGEWDDGEWDDDE